MHVFYISCILLFKYNKYNEDLLLNFFLILFAHLKLRHLNLHLPNVIST